MMGGVKGRLWGDGVDGGGGRGLHVSKEMGIKRGGKGDDTPFCTMSCIAYLEIDVLNYSTIVLSH